MVFFLGAKIRRMVGEGQAQNGRFVVWRVRIEDIEDGLLGLWAWWDGRDKKVGRRGCEG